MIRGMVTMNAHAFHPASEPAADLGDRHDLPGRNHTQTPELPTYHADRMMVDQADLP